MRITSRLDYLKIKNKSESGASIYFYGDIVGDEWEKWVDTDTCPQDVLNALKEVEGKDLDIYINSGGGSVFAGLAIYNMLSRFNGKKTCHVDGVAASIASVICMAGDEIYMPGNAFLMIHKPSNVVWGNATEMRKMADDLDIIQTGIENVYKSKLKHGIEISTIIDLMEKETWLTAEQAKEYFNIKVLEDNSAVAKLETGQNYRNIPQSLIENKSKINDDIKNKLQVELDLLNV